MVQNAWYRLHGEIVQGTRKEFIRYGNVSSSAVQCWVRGGAHLHEVLLSNLVIAGLDLLEDARQHMALVDLKVEAVQLRQEHQVLANEVAQVLQAT